MPFSLRGAARGSQGQGPMEQEGPGAVRAAGEPAGSRPARDQPARGATSRVGQESPGPGSSGGGVPRQGSSALAKKQDLNKTAVPARKTGTCETAPLAGSRCRWPPSQQLKGD